MSEKANKKKSLLAYYSRFKQRYELTGIILILLGLVIVSSMLSSKFFTPNNLLNVLRQSSVTAVLAYSETVLIIMGCIDLSVGSIAALGGILGIYVYAATGNLLLAILVAMISGGIISFISGLFVHQIANNRLYIRNRDCITHAFHIL